MAASDQFNLGGFFDNVTNNAAKALAAFTAFDSARDDRKLRAKELENQARRLSVQAAETAKERELAAADAARSINLQDNVYKVASVLAIGALAGVGGWAIAKVIKAFRRR